MAVTLALILVLITGCTAGSDLKNPAGSPAETRLAYAAADGIYVRDLTDLLSGRESVGKAESGLQGEPVRIYEGAGLAGPVFSQDGTRLMFKQMSEQTSEETGDYRSTLYAYDFKTGQAVKVLDDPVSYNAGPGGSFVVSTEAGRILGVDFSVEDPGDSGESDDAGKIDGSGEQGGLALALKTEELQVWPEDVEKHPLVSIQYDNLMPSPDFHYLAYNVRVKDDRTDNRPEGFGPYYSGGLYVLDWDTGKAATVVEPIRATEEIMGNDPKPGPWSPDGKTLWVWNGPQSASLTADGINGFFYHADTGKPTEFSPMLLAYDENISYSREGTAAVLTGAGREMFSDKSVDLVADYSGPTAKFQEAEAIAKKGLVPAMPQLSADGSTLYFAGVDKKTIGAYPLKRQLYSLKLDQSQDLRQITSDPEYRNESPILLNNQKDLIFGRAGARDYDGRMEIWMTSVDGKDEIKLAGWTEPENGNQWVMERYNDYYGRGNWSGIFTIYDGTK
ncbi:MAG TPA: hypothetical protein PKA19_02955 [Bacillota bacterium]|nr:hypothetical protein [Bacillota bacterium]